MTVTVTNIQREMIYSNRHLLESVNNDLKESLRMATIDFMAVNTLLKSAYARIDANPLQPVHANVKSKIETMMCGLQYMDIFNQRVEHLIRAHEEMLDSPMAFNFEQSFFHLHVFQSMTIELDLLRSISVIKTILNDLKDYFTQYGKMALATEAYFGHTGGIRGILQRTMDALIKAGGDTRKLPIPALNPDQIELLNSLYTMECERVVLTWFTNSMPYGTWEELFQYYENAFNQIAIDNTELF